MRWALVGIIFMYKESIFREVMQEACQIVMVTAHKSHSKTLLN